MLKSIIIDDHRASIQILSTYIENTEGIELISSFEDPLSALHYLRQNRQINLIFLDIEMPDLSGLDFLSILSNSNQDAVPSMVIFATGHSLHAVSGLNQYDTVIGCLQKIYTYKNFQEVVQKAQRLLPLYESKMPAGTKAQNVERINNRHMFVKTCINKREKYERLHLHDLLYAKSERNYVALISTNTRHLVRCPLHQIEHQLAKDTFVRIHHSYLINFHRIRLIEARHVVLDNQVSLPISDKYRTELIRRISACLVQDR